jgi:Leucine-rich repeat (LRR) protein
VTLTRVSALAFSNNNLLRELHLNNNAISNINKNVFSKLPNLEILDLSYNKIGEGNGGSILVYLVSQVNGSKMRFCMPKPCKYTCAHVKQRL